MEKEVQSVAVIPAYREGQTIGNVVQAALLAESVDAVVVVNDGSEDETAFVALEAYEEHDVTRRKPLVIANHSHNLGKAEAMRTGAFYANELGGTALRALMFLDADLSPLWSRETPQNRKLGSTIINCLKRRNSGDYVMVDQEVREKAFQAQLAQHIDGALKEILSGRNVMTIATCQRNKLVDWLRVKLSWGALSGNRSISAELWDRVIQVLDNSEIRVNGWEAEAALNTYTRKNRTSEGIKLNRMIKKIDMRDVVNVGSRVKTGSLVKGLLRMASIHGRALWGFIKFGVKL